MKKLYVTAFTIFFASISLMANIVYVKHDAQGNNDGTTWTDAFTSLTVALDSAKGGDSLWVAAGVYKPGTVRTDYFAMKKDVDLFGGFNGTETEFEQRDFEKNKVLLSGDIGAEGIHTDNCKNVVIVPKGTGGTVTIDGFTIAFGYSTDVNWSQRSYGAGIWIRSGNSPYIVNCLLYMNRTKWGGALAIDTDWRNPSHPRIVKCKFVNNHAWANGGAIQNQGYANPTISHCEFIGNSAKSSGGAIYSHMDHAAILNSLFIGNWAGSGGALVHDNYGSGSIYNSAFIGNYSRGANAAIRSRGLTIRNSIVWGNSAQYFSDTSMTGQITGIANSYNCIIENSSASIPGANNLNLDPLLFDYKGYDNIAGTLDDYAYILQGSSAIDAGDSTKLHKDSYDLDKDGNTSELVSLDLLMNSRIVGDNVDIGVFEGAFDPSHLISMNVQAFPLNKAANIRWEPETMDNIEAFKLYRSSIAGIWEFVADIDKQGRGYTVGMQENGTLYHYKIVAVDASGNEFGYNNIDAVVPRMEQGNAANFNGSSNYISIPDSLLFEDESSISMWVKLSAEPVSDTMMIVSKQFSYALSAVKAIDGLYYLRTQTGDGEQWVDEVNGTKALALDKWTYITNTFNHTSFEQQLFINRDLDISSTGTITNAINNNLTTIGSLKDTSGVYTYHFKGQIDEVCFWDKTLLSEDVINTMDAPLKGNEEGVVALWHFDEHNNTYQKIAFDACKDRINLRADLVSFVASGAMVPDAPVAGTIEFAKPGVKIDWTYIETDIKEFNIYRYTSSNSTKVLIGSTSETTFTDLDVIPTNDEFFYYITSVDNGMNESEKSETLSITFDVPPAPLNISATNLKETVKIEWDLVTEYDAFALLNYEIFRADTNTVDSAKLIGIVAGDVASFIDENLTDSTEYFYWVKTRAEYELASDFSSVASIFFTKNKAPKLIETFPDIKETFNNLPVSIDISHLFSDPEGQPLTIEATVSANSSASVTVDGQTMTINTLSDTPFEIMITATDNWGDTEQTSFMVTPVYQTEESVSICFGQEYKGFTEQGEHILELTSINGCDSIATVHLTVIAPIEVTEEIEICEGESYESYAETGTFTRTLTTASGCDSIVTTNLTVNPVYEMTESVSICEGGEYNGKTEAGTYTFEYVSIKGCDSIVTVELAVNPIYEINEVVTICQGEEYDGYTEAGEYTKTLVSTIGCDSIVNLNLTVTPIIETSEEVTICAGEEYEGNTESGEYTRTLTSITGCDSIVTTLLTVLAPIETTEVIEICEGDSYEDHTETGSFTRTFTAVSGCDSIVTTNLTVNPLYDLTESVSICEGGEYKGKTEAGTYTFEYVSIKGCDSIVTVELAVNSYYEINEVVAICQGDSYDGHTESGEYTKTLVSTIGCDSIVNLNLTVNPIVETTEEVTICAGQEYEGYTESAEYTKTLKSTTGCDSIVTVYLTVSPPIETTEDIEICEGDSYENQTETGTYTRTLTTASGCDSIVTTNLIVNPAYKINNNVTICEGGEYNGKTEAGTYTFEFESVKGCDSIVIVELAVNSYYEINESVTICEGDSYDGHTESGEYTKTLISTIGCDSIVNLNLTVNPIVETTVKMTICAGQEYEGYSESAEFTKTLSSATGCDSIVTTQLTVLPVIETTEDVEICEGSSYEGHAENTTFTRTLTSTNGCDSTVITNLTVHQIITTHIDTTVFEGESIIINNIQISEEGVYTETLTSSFGCDSIITYTVSIEHNTTNISHTANVSVEIAPIPVKDICTLQFSSPINDQCNIQITGTDGRIVYDKAHKPIKKNITLNLSSLASGVYLVTVTSEYSQTTSKIVKE